MRLDQQLLLAYTLDGDSAAGTLGDVASMMLRWRRVAGESVTSRKEDTFLFHDPGKLVDGDLELVLVDTYPGEPGKGWVPAYSFEMRKVGSGTYLGRIDLRVGETEHLARYAGHLGYRVEPAHRGHRYAARACRMLLPLARNHGLHTVWITCNPENLASRRTCELAGAEFVEIVDLPRETEMYQRGERRKCRYRLDVFAEEGSTRDGQ